MWDSHRFTLVIASAIIGLVMLLLFDKTKPRTFFSWIFGITLSVVVLYGLFNLVVLIFGHIGDWFPDPSPCLDPDYCDPSNQIP